MMLQTVRLGLALAGALVCSSVVKAETEAETAARLKWFTDARFGMFIHFGAYSLAARHEWVKNYENLSDADYQRYVENFDPDLFDAKEWVQAAKGAGMKYIVLTTKHHEGFCLFGGIRSSARRTGKASS